MTSTNLGMVVVVGCLAAMVPAASEFDYNLQPLDRVIPVSSPVAPGWLLRSGGLTDAIAAGGLFRKGSIRVDGLVPEPPAQPLVTSLVRPGKVQSVRIVQGP